MHFLIYIVEGLSILLSANAFNYYPLNLVSQAHNHNLPYQDYNPYSLSQNVPTPFSPRYFLFGKLNSTFPTFPRVQACMSIFLPDVHGSCLNLATCFLKGGKPVGKCNFGFKSCCIPLGGSSALPISTFTRNSFTQDPATFTIRPSSPQFCQVRLDFKSFDVGETNPDGFCINNQGLRISGALNTNGIPDVICGQNTGMHVYLNFDGTNPITLTIDFDDTLQNTTNQWSIKVTQIPCSDTTVPQECLQYYPESAGTVQSFNFRNVDSISINDIPITTYQLSNTNYFICIGPQTSNSFSTITWSKGVGTTSYYFAVNGPSGLFPPDVAGTLKVSRVGADCSGGQISTEDYVEIQNGVSRDVDGNTVTHTLYCGLGFPSTVTSTTKPFRLRVFTDETEEFPQPGSNNFEESVGFSLSYTLS